MTFPSILLAKTVSLFQLDQNAPPTLKQRIDQTISYPCVRACISVHLTHVDPRDGPLCVLAEAVLPLVFFVSLCIYTRMNTSDIYLRVTVLKKRDCSSVTYACHCPLKMSGRERRCKSARACTPSVRSWSSHTHTRSDMHGWVPHIPMYHAWMHVKIGHTSRPAGHPIVVFRKSI
jgi:hypothetical protein